MSDLELLRNQLRLNPDDDALYGAYADALEELAELTPEQARAEAQNARETFTTTDEMVRAARLMQPGTYSRRRLIPAIYKHAKVNRRIPTDVYLVAGYVEPTLQQHWCTVGERTQLVSWFDVGARWVLTWWETRPIGPGGRPANARRKSR